MSRRGSLSSYVVVAAASLALVACDIPNPGVPPAPATLNFPIALGLAPDATQTDPSRWLLVVSSNYDARYNQGSILSLDMVEIQRRLDLVRHNGRSVGCTNGPAWTDVSVECQIAEAIDVMAGHCTRDAQCSTGHCDAGFCRRTDNATPEVWVDSFAAGLVRTPQPAGNRFYLPTRASADLTWVDIDNATGALQCEQAPGSMRCGDYRRTTRVDTRCAGRDVTMVGDPTGLVAMQHPDDPTRDMLVMVLRHGSNPSRAALYIDGPAIAPRTGREPVRTHVLTGLPPDAINAELEPSTGLTWISTASPVSNRATRLLARVGVEIDPSNDACSQAFAAPPVVLDGISTGFESRDVAFSSDPANRFAYVLSRSPESIITIDQQGTPFVRGGSAIIDVQDVGFGPSRMRAAMIGGRQFLIATCFDGRATWVMSTRPTQVASIVPGFDGAYELVVDESRDLAIVADFKTSVLRFVDLAPLRVGGPAVVIARVGAPRTHVGFP